MKILVTTPQGEIFDRHFPPEAIGRLKVLGDVRLNQNTKQLTRDELKKELADTDIVMTHWGSTQYDAGLLDARAEAENPRALRRNGRAYRERGVLQT